MRHLRRWPTLYKKSPTTGKIQTWKIWVEGSTIFTEAGAEGSKLKSSKDTIKEGKNIGRSNETTKEQQAEAEAASKYQKYLDKGYVVGTSGMGGKTASLVFPMLAHDFKKHKHKISYPVICQPKLDGVRSIFQDGKLISRGGKMLAQLPHILKELNGIFIDSAFPDGEIYNHELKKEFEEIVSSIKKAKGHNPKAHLAQYHIYDVVDTKCRDIPFEHRYRLLEKAFKAANPSSCIQLVPCYKANNEADVLAAHSQFLEKGYEGTMIRSLDGPYEANQRSYHLLKLKEFEDSEFRIIGIKEGRGQLQGCVGKFVLEIDDELGKRTFDCILAGKDRNKFLKEAFTNHKLWKGKWMQVKFMGYTNAGNVPRHPVGLKIRDAE